MAELFKIAKGEKAQPIDEFAFQDELNDLEPFIKENPQVLGESIEIFDEQVDTGAGDRIDLLGLDKTAGTAQITLIELKNEFAQQPVLLQTLRYASWVKNNPDSIKYLLEKKRLPMKNVDFNPKIIIVAPQIDPALLELSQYTDAFDFDFIEIRRFRSKENCYLIVEHKIPPQVLVTKVRTREEWDWGKYESKLGISKDQIRIGQELYKRIENICEKHQWSITPRFNQYYIAFKFGGRNVLLINFWVSQIGPCYLGFKLGQSPEEVGLVDPYPDAKHEYWKSAGEYYVRVEKPDLEIDGYIPFMEAAYRSVTKG